MSSEPIRFRWSTLAKLACGVVLSLFFSGVPGVPGIPARGDRASASRSKAVIPIGHIHKTGPHKVLVRSDDPRTIAALKARGVVRRQIDYGSLQLLVVDDTVKHALTSGAFPGAVLRDDMDLIGLSKYLVDTTPDEPDGIPQDRTDTPGLYAKQLYLVQFAGPVQDAWLADITSSGDATLVSYVPNNAYCVFATSDAWNRISGQVSQSVGSIQWAGVYHPAYRISPQLEDAILQNDPAVDVVVEIVEHQGIDATVARLNGEASAILMQEVSQGGLRDIRIRIPASLITEIADEPDVFWIEPAAQKTLLDERQGQILAGNLDASGVQPSAPGYLAWLTGKGFGATFTFSVDVADDGLDRGSTTDVHQDFKTAGGTSRVSYVNNYTTDPAGDSGGGHGNINAAIVGGFNDTQSNPAYEDAGGYQYGLGIAPFARVGASKIFDNFGGFTTSPYTTLIAGAYNAGARISTNSWGLCRFFCSEPVNEYTTDSRTYDMLVRDAVSGTAGNQEMSIVFAAANFGPGLNTVSAPGNAKNILSVGASENFRQTGTDGCGIDNTGADNAKDIIFFSSRGPTADGRTKPDIMAPGTHIQGAASRSVNYDGAGVCDQYWPVGQTLYAWSSGTSHSTPAVAGAAALARQYFANQGWGTPSPAMTKAFLMATPAYMTGVGANDTLPSNNQGYGRLDLGRAFSGTSSLRVDQTQVFGAPGQTYTLTGNIASSTQPFRVMLAWTDAPGATSGNAWVNDLDLEVMVNGTLYRGNVFSGANSVAGGVADTRNNTEAVFLPAGTTGSFSITVRATGVNGDGVPGNADVTDQDFALYVYNAAQPAPDFTIGATPSSRTASQSGSTTYTATVTSVNAFASATTLAVTGLPAGATGSFAPNPVTPPANGSTSSTLTVTTGASTPAGNYTLTITGTSGALSHNTTVSLTVVQNTTLEAGYAHNVSIHTDGTVWAWGLNGNGQVGDGTTINRNAPVRSGTLTNVVSVAAGVFHTVALRSDGTVWTWGGNADGQLGDGTTLQHNAPAQVPGLSGIVGVAAGAFHTLALKNDGTLMAWGDNWQGQIGDGTTTDRPAPVVVSGMTSVKSLSGGAYHSIAVRTDGSVWTWGRNAEGELGDGTSVLTRPLAGAVPGLTGVTKVSAGAYFNLALISDGTMKAWGHNYYGQLGDNTELERRTPVVVIGMNSVTDIAAGSGFSLALRSNGTVWSWGQNVAGQLGDGTTTNRKLAAQVPGVSGIVAIAAAEDHSIARDASLRVFGWGSNAYGQLGTAPSPQLTPIFVTSESIHQWLPSTVENTPNDAGEFSSIAVDPLGRTWIAYTDRTDGALKVARRVGGGFRIDVVDTANQTGWYPSLAIASDGTVHVIYTDGTRVMVKHAWLPPSGAWQVEDVAQASCTLPTSLALDSQNRLVVAFQDCNSTRTRIYAKTTSWFEAYTAYGARPSIKMQGGLPQLSYFDHTSSPTRLVWLFSTGSYGSWTFDGAFIADTSGATDNSLALTPQGDPRISFYSTTSHTLRMAKRIAGVWSVETVDASGGDVGAWNSIALDASSFPRISYHANGLLKLAEFNGTGWLYSVADDAANAGTSTSLAIDGAGNDRISYYDAVNRNPKYAISQFDATPPSSPTLSVTPGRTTAAAIWTAPGDDGAGGGSVWSYDLRVSSTPLDEWSFEQATKANAPFPLPPGYQQCGDVMNLNPCSPYYFALRVVDDVGNVSWLGQVSFATSCSPGFEVICD